MPKVKRILLISLSLEKIYEGTNLRKTVPMIPSLGLAYIAGSLLEENHEVNVFDFNLQGNDDRKFIGEVERFQPDFVGISFVTPLIKEADRIARIVKRFNQNILVIGGGPHCSSFPESSLKETSLDIAVVGEGDFIIKDIANEKNLSEIQGIAYKKDGEIFVNKRRDFVNDLDTLPIPALHLFKINQYKTSSTIVRKNPATGLETSRGCVYRCVYCNKSCFGMTFRTKSPERVVEEFVRIKNMGFKEILLADDGFTTDIERAKKVCDLLIEKKVNMNWCASNGIRVNRVDSEVLRKMKQAGCYRVYYGIESGNQEVLNRMKKGITLEQVRKAVRWGKEAGLEVIGYFMIGLPGETEKTMQETIDFAKSLDLDLCKMSITIPLPATELFEELDRKGLIKVYDWTKFKFYSTPSDIYNHENLSWDTINKYYAKFYREIYLNPRFMLKRIKNGIKNGTLIDDIKAGLSIKWI